MPSVFVTGGSDFLGLILLKQLLKLGHDVTNVDLLPCAIQHPRLRSFTGDMRDRAVLDTALASANQQLPVGHQLRRAGARQPAKIGIIRAPKWMS
jgi:nucleoside-diphosphate-sugar epimerase